MHNCVKGMVMLDENQTIKKQSQICFSIDIKDNAHMAKHMQKHLLLNHKTTALSLMLNSIPERQNDAKNSAVLLAYVCDAELGQDLIYVGIDSLQTDQSLQN